MPRKYHRAGNNNNQREACKKNFAKMRLASVPSSIEQAYPYMTKKQVLICKNAIILIKLILKKW